MEAVGGSAVHTAVLAWCSGDLHDFASMTRRPAWLSLATTT
jgi:hypothetical protein